MIRRTNQSWQVGQQVRVGFLTLKVLAAVATPNDGLPDLYFLSNLAGDKLYQFIPHNGLHRVSVDEAARRMAEFRAHCELVVKQQIAKAAQQARIRALFTQVFEVAA